MNKLIEKIENRISEISELIRPVGWSKKIEVVETKAVIDIIQEESKAYNESVKGDLISRSALIEKFDADFSEGLIDCFDDVIGIVENQPTACNDGWISVKDGLPIGEEYKIRVDGETLYKHVLAMVADSECPYDIVFYDQEEETWVDKNGFYADVTHWQPLPTLPQPYKENENE